MIESIRNIFKIPELRKRLLFTLAMLAIYRVGAHIPTPGIDTVALSNLFERAAKGTILGFFDMFSGGAFRNLTVFSLGIMPYISASIILQLLTVVIPYLEKLAKEGEEGRKKITQYTRYGTVILSIIQAAGISLGLVKMRGIGGEPIVISPSLKFHFMTILTLTAGTAFIMWIGEQITERGIGNGISLLISAGIIVRLPSATFGTVERIVNNELKLYKFIFILGIMVIVVAGVVILQQAQRRIPVQYPKRVVGRRIMGGASTHIPLRINTAGVIPIIFASSIIMFPVTLFKFLGGSNPDRAWVDSIIEALSPGALAYSIIYIALIIFFCYFYTAIIFNPVDLADNMRKYGGFIPGIRAGKQTANYIDKVLTRITLAGAIFLSLIAILPTFLIKWFNVPFYFGGTALLIVVGVGLDTLQQLESHLLMRHYEGFMKGKRLKGRRR